MVSENLIPELSADRDKQLAEELAELSEEATEMLALAIYFGMSDAEALVYDQLRSRIREIKILLGEYLQLRFC
jgi:hypothetical protein